MAAEPRWMPVFVVVEATRPRPQVAAHPSYAGSLGAGLPPESEDFRFPAAGRMWLEAKSR